MDGEFKLPDSNAYARVGRGKLVEGFPEEGAANVALRLT